MIIIKRNVLLLITLLPVIFIGACHVYSFSGASISPEIKTVSISFFPNRAAIIQPTLSQLFTEKLKDKFVSLTNLRLTDIDSDISFEGYITDYRTQPIAIQGNETAAQNRLTITVFVKFVNTNDPKQNFESPFTRYYDYDSQISLASIEQDAITQINKQLVDDIFNRAVSNW